MNLRPETLAFPSVHDLREFADHLKAQALKPWFTPQQQSTILAKVADLGRLIGSYEDPAVPEDERYQAGDIVRVADWGDHLGLDISASSAQEPRDAEGAYEQAGSGWMSASEECVAGKDLLEQIDGLMLAAQDEVSGAAGPATSREVARCMEGLARRAAGDYEGLGVTLREAGRLFMHRADALEALAFLRPNHQMDDFGGILLSADEACEAILALLGDELAFEFHAPAQRACCPIGGIGS